MSATVALANVSCPQCRGSFEVSPYAPIPLTCPSCGARVLGAYVVERLIGSGAMGDVYESFRPDMQNRRAALKIPKMSDEQSRQRFDREIAASAMLRQENIVRAIDCGQWQGRPFLVMELHVGRLLEELVRVEGPLTPRRLVHVLIGVARGLDHASRLGVVNRDLKPENLLILDEDRAMILDYGLALIGGAEVAPDRATDPGTRLGTVAFMAPEQARDPRRVTIQADVYALGCTAYFALTGQPPFEGKGQEVLRQHASAARPVVREKRPDVPEELGRLIQRMMAIDPLDRPRPRDLVERLEAMHERWESPAESVASMPWSGRAPEVVDDEPTVVGEIMDEFESASARDADDESLPIGEVIDEGHAPTPLPSWQAHPPPVSVGTDDRGTDSDCGRGTVVTPPAGGEAHVSTIDNQDLPTHAEARGFTPEIVEGVVVESSPDENRWSVPFEASRPVDPPPSSDPLAEIATLPTSAIVEEGPAAPYQGPPPEASPAKPAASEPARRRPWSPRGKFIATCVATFIAMAGLFGMVQLIKPTPDPDQDWQALQEDYQLHKWRAVQDRLQEFALKYPEDPRTAQIPFFEKMCDAGRDVFSQTGDPYRGLAAIEKIFQEYRDTKEYELYCSDLFLALQRLVERFVEQGEKSLKLEPLGGAERAFALLTTVSLAMPDNWVPEVKEKLSAKIAEAKAKVEIALAKRDILQQLAAAESAGTTLEQLDEFYRGIESQLERFTPLGNDAEIQQKLAALRASEAQRVHYEPQLVEDVRVETEGENPYLFVVWDQPTTGPAPALSSETAVALVHGVLYAFDEHGHFRWARRLGIDTHRLPISLEPTSTQGQALVAVSSLDNSLVALDVNSGQTIWRYRAGAEQDLSAPLTISRWRPAANEPPRVRGLLPTGSGEVHVLDLVRGRLMGRFKTGSPMTVGGTYDPERQLAFFPADSKRVFILDPAVIESAEPVVPGRGVLFSHHRSGSLRAPPAVVGPYLILTEATDLDHTTIRAFHLGQGSQVIRDPESPPLTEIRMSGWSWFEHPATPDRLSLVTDEGVLGVLGVNLDNPAEALFPLIQDSQGKLPRLQVDSPYRAVAVHSEEHLLWVVAGGTLRKIVLDVLNQQVVTAWPNPDQPARQEGIPLHEGLMDRDADRIYLATRTLKGDRFQFAAIDAEQGTPIWQRQLGVYPVGEPLLEANRAVFVDQSGRWLAVETNPAHLRDLPFTVDPHAPPAEATGDVQRIRDLQGNEFLVIELRHGKALAIRPLTAAGAGPLPWRTVTLPSVTAQGKPAVLGQDLVVPCSDGRLYRMMFTGREAGSRNAQTIAWSPHQPLPDERAEVYPLDESTVLLVHGNSARWLNYVVKDAVEQWQDVGPPFLAAARLTAPPAVNPTHVFLADEQNTLYRLPRSGLKPTADSLQLPARITDGPFLFQDRLLVVLGDRSVIAFDAAADAVEFRQLWGTGATAGRICGQPQVLGRALIVTDESGSITISQLADGQPVRTILLPEGAVPSAGAVRIGTRFLVPLADGTLYWQPQEAARSSPAVSSGGAR